MEIKCKLSFTLPESLIEALDIDEDTPIIASVTGNRVLLEIVDEGTEEDDEIPVKSHWRCDDDCDNWWEEYDSFDDECDKDCSCDECEYFCPNCGSCVLA